MYVNIKITPTAKEGLDWLKSAHNATNFSECITTISTFFKNNNISPKESISNNFSNSLFELRKEFLLKFDEILDKNNSNTERIIKLNRRIEEDFIKPINRKIIDIHKSNIDNHNVEENTKLVKEIETNIVSKNDSKEIENLNSRIAKLNDTLTVHNTTISEQSDKINEYHRCMEMLSKNIKVESTSTGKKIFIDLPIDTVESLFYLIPE